MTNRACWSADDFEVLSWHDNHIHGFRVVAGQHGAGELILDIDFIVEWICADRHVRFRIAPADLVFHAVSNLKLSFDYAKESLAFGPLSIHEVRRAPKVYPTGYRSWHWSITLNSPDGRIEFDAPGFTMALRASPVETDMQCLEPTQRTAAV